MLTIQMTLSNSDGDTVDVTETAYLSLPSPYSHSHHNRLEDVEKTIELVVDRAKRRLIGGTNIEGVV